MQKRTILAIVLSVFVLILYSAIVSRMYPLVNKQDTSKFSNETAQKKPSDFSPVGPPERPRPSDIRSGESSVGGSAISGAKTTVLPVSPQEFSEIENDDLKITFANPGAYVQKVELKKYHTPLFIEGLFLADDEAGYNFTAQKIPEGIIFVFRDQEREIIKRVSFCNSSYTIEIERKARFFNIDTASYSYPLRLNLSILKEHSGQDNRFMEAVVAQGKTILRKPLLGLKPGVLFSGNADWMGLRDRYFAFIFKSESKISRVSAESAGQFPQLLVQVEAVSQGAGNYTDNFKLYFGPQNLKSLVAAGAGFESILYYGVFDVISEILLSVLRFLFGITHNWGVAILFFSVFIFIFLYPLTLKQTRSMREMQLLQPKIKELQEKYKGDSYKLNKEILELYKAHKVNPMGGCLPMLLQIPIFFALYQALMRFVELKGAQFLWIKDLSAPDRLMVLPNKLPIIGSDINLLPVLMMLSMFVQQKMSSATMTGTGSAEQQKLMLILMPLLFGMLFYSMPAGLVLYWFMYGFFSAGSQWLAVRQKRVKV